MLRTKPRLLVAAINYAPEPTGPAIVTRGFAEALVERGWDVELITALPHYPAWRLEHAARDETLGGVRVRRSRLYVPARQSAVRRGLYELSWLASAAGPALRSSPIDLVLGVVPSLSAGVLAQMAAARYRAPYLLLFQDVVGRAALQAGIPGGAQVAGLASRVEVSMAKHARGIAVIAEGFRDYFESAGLDARRIVRVRNPARLAGSHESRGAVRARLGWDEREVVVLHSGSMGHKQGLENVIRAAKLAEGGSPVRFVLQGDGNQRDGLMRLAEELRPANLSFLPLAPAEQFPGILAAADVLLVNQRKTVRNMSLPSKLGTYFAAGKPVLAAVAKDDEVAREIELARAGLVVEPDNPRVLVDAVVELAREPRRAGELGAAGRSYAETSLTPDAAANALDGWLESALAGRVRAYADATG